MCLYQLFDEMLCNKFSAVGTTKKVGFLQFENIKVLIDKMMHTVVPLIKYQKGVQLFFKMSNQNKRKRLKQQQQIHV